MNKLEILNSLKQCKLNKRQIIIISGSALVLQGVICDTPDIDMSCSSQFYKQIKWPSKMGACGKKIKYSGIFEISNNLYYPNDVVKINGYKVLNLNKCLQIKKMLNRPKDAKTIQIIEKYIKENSNEQQK